MNEEQAWVRACVRACLEFEHRAPSAAHCTRLLCPMCVCVCTRVVPSIAAVAELLLLRCSLRLPLRRCVEHTQKKCIHYILGHMRSHKVVHIYIYVYIEQHKLNRRRATTMATTRIFWKRCKRNALSKPHTLDNVA